MSVGVLTPARAVRRPWRPDPRALLGAGLVLVGIVGYAVVAGLTADTRAVVVAARDRPAGATLAPGDLAVARVRVDDAIYAAAIRGDELEALAGRSLPTPLYAGQVLARAQVVDRPPPAPGQVLMTIAVPPERAVGGRLRPGDLVRVLATESGPGGRAVVAVPRATVVELGRESPPGVATGRGDGPPLAWATLLVGEAEAVGLAQAKNTGQLDLALLPPDAEPPAEAGGGSR